MKRIRYVCKLILCFFIILLSISQNMFAALAATNTAEPDIVTEGNVVTAGAPAGIVVYNNSSVKKNKTENPNKLYKNIYEIVDDVYKNESKEYRKKVKDIIKSKLWYDYRGCSDKNRDKYLKNMVVEYNKGNTGTVESFLSEIVQIENPTEYAIDDSWSEATDDLLKEEAATVLGSVAGMFTGGLGTTVATTVGGAWLGGTFDSVPDNSTSAGSFYYNMPANKQYKSLDDLLNAIYGANSKKKKIIKKCLNQDKSIENSIKSKSGWYKPNKKFLTILSNMEKSAIESSNPSTNINASESLAVGDMYSDSKYSNATVSYKSEDPGLIEKPVAELLTSLGNSINDLVGLCDGTLDKLVYGRLVYYGTNFFSFELVKGNPYGIVGSYVYKLFRNLVIPILILLLFSKFAKAAWSSGNGEQRRLFKDTLGRTVLMLLLVFLIPNIVDALIAVRDIVLNYLSSNLSSDMSSFFGLDVGNDKSLVGYYKTNADSGFLLDALLYLGVSFISIFYMITYISTAVAVMVSFMFFPLIVIFSFTENKMIDMWFKELIGNIFVPVLDAVLLLMPLMLNQFLPNSGVKAYLISFIACYSVIPSRAVIRGMLGVGGNIRSELLGFGALMGTMRMLSGIKNRVTGGVKGLWGAHKQNKADREKADMYADLARANGEGGQLTGKFASLGKLSSTEEKDDKNGIGGLSSSAVQSNPIGEENTESVGDKPLQDENGQPVQKLDSTVDEDEKNNENNELGGDGVSSVNVSNGTEAPESVGDANGDGNTEGAGTEPLGNTGDGNTGDVGKTEEAELNGEGIAAASANEDATNTGVDGVEARTPEEQREIDKKNVLKGYVNTDNFENKEFKNCLNFAERAKMHRQRANRNAINSALGAVGSVAGGVGMGALGAAAFGGATMFAGSRVNMTATTAGANMGSAVGSHIGGATGRTVSAVASGIHEVAKTGSSHPIRQSAARVGEMVIREAGVAPGVANKLYRATEGYKTKPNDSTFAHRLAFDPRQTTVPQRSSAYGNNNSRGKAKEVYLNSASSMEPNNYSTSPLSQLNESIQEAQIPDQIPEFEYNPLQTDFDFKQHDFSTLENTVATLGMSMDALPDYIDETMDAFIDESDPLYDQLNEQLDKMREEDAVKRQKNMDKLYDNYKNKVPGFETYDEYREKVREEDERMDNDYKATIIRDEYFNELADSYRRHYNKIDGNVGQGKIIKKTCLNLMNEVLKQRDNDTLLLDFIRKRIK